MNTTNNVTDDTQLFTGATEPFADWDATAEETSIFTGTEAEPFEDWDDFDDVMSELDYYQRRDLVQHLHQTGGSWVAADFAADRADENERIEAGR